ncbi:ABC-three component system protein [Pectobacterium versatile]|uniref:ABC-three component system protein n=1 Tax=Pectobacterium versatile TaxID=2488639 RepID=UPI0030187B8A
MTGASNNATLNILGFDYQKFIALERCLSGKDNDVIWIECFGDVAHNGTSTEVKHHISETFLNDTHRDFWKTLYNLMSDESIYSNFTRFELLTTSKIKEDSAFFQWNDLPAKTKLERLRKIRPTKTIEKYHQEFVNRSDDEISPLIEKLKIISSQPNINDKLEKIKLHESLFLIPDIHKETFIEKMLGFISLKAIKNTEMWHIEYNEFKREMIGFSMPYVQKDYPFPVVSKKDIKREDSDNYYFVNELESINIENNMITDAVIDYLRSEKSLLKLIKLHSTLAESLDDFEDDLLQDLGLLKLKHKSDLQATVTSIDEKNQSKKMYADCLLLQMKQIRNVHSMEKYYQKGRIHSHVEQKNFSWLFEVIENEAK